MPSGAKPKKYPARMVAEVKHLYAKNMTQGEIAAKTGTTQKVVWRLMRRHGIDARVAAKRDQGGSKNHAWKGAAAGYAALHLRVQSLRGRPRKCEVCGSTSRRRVYDWANLTGAYDDPFDYKRMCRSCHAKHDGTVRNLKGGRPR